ncbi:MAG: hypothetical protein Q3988_00565 [Gemella sp.]|nr:hypothetical protein [Gemella sp.]
MTVMENAVFIRNVYLKNDRSPESISKIKSFLNSEERMPVTNLLIKKSAEAVLVLFGLKDEPSDDDVEYFMNLFKTYKEEKLFV